MLASDGSGYWINRSALFLLLMRLRSGYLEWNRSVDPASSVAPLLSAESFLLPQRVLYTSYA